MSIHEFAACSYCPMLDSDERKSLCNNPSSVQFRKELTLEEDVVWCKSLILISNTQKSSRGIVIPILPSIYNELPLDSQLRWIPQETITSTWTTNTPYYTTSTDLVQWYMKETRDAFRIIHWMSDVEIEAYLLRNRAYFDANGNMAYYPRDRK
jgi:hypothetical protein